MPTTLAPAVRVDLDRARAFRHRRQGLAAAVPGEGVGALADRTGWARTLGGIEAYLALRARAPGLSRAAVDEALARREVQVVPAVRGCMYVVPREDVPLVLKIAEAQARPRTDRDLQKAGVAWREIETAAEAVAAALEAGPMSTDALRRALPDGAVRSLGEAGRKVGLSSTLPVALRHLEFEGRVERELLGGRLDTERYAWRLAAGDPGAAQRVPEDPADRVAALAGRFFRQAAPASLRDFCEWAALSQKDARAATQRLPLVPVEVSGDGEPALCFEEDARALADADPPAGGWSLLPIEDNYLTWHGGPGRVADPADHGVIVDSWGMSRPVPLGEARHFAQRALLEGDRLAGTWEYDPDAGEVVWATFRPTAGRGLDGLRALAEATARYIGEEVGNCRTVSLDTLEAVRARAAEVRRRRDAGAR